MRERLALIDLGAGNLRSVENALRAAGADQVEVTADPEAVRSAERIVLPGVGAFAACMDALQAIPGMADALGERVVQGGAPFLGICVGMQMLADVGEEYGEHAGLGWIGGTVRPLKPTATAKVPHMGWNDVAPTRGHALLPPGEAYFLHSFAFDARDPTEVLAWTDHAGPVVAAVGRDNIAGVQFHPEKSQAYGLAMLARFLEWRP
ncbi:imidazole glycerol phosphate synthase subunit HisH [Sphingomonas jatrophae]|uniref:Imidazole glycerol phosphate synthase subunit HisH n=1 Tax=Sphingomonas jatrophae TaxID=1166337 RepID=A0A1I6JQV5_9SPHN|nr:imidazole glycerol phosphate synthase subunit HisH [Sphingomonas jatrophae]SFR81379.1 glutamine amidotransferase [Sphingomonas jatrophae]